MAPPEREVSRAQLEEELETFRRGMARALRRGEDSTLQELTVVYGRLRARHAALVQEERAEAERASRAQQAAVVPASAEEQRRVADRVEEDRRWRKVIAMRRGGRAERYW